MKKQNFGEKLHETSVTMNTNTDLKQQRDMEERTEVAVRSFRPEPGAVDAPTMELADPVRLVLILTPFLSLSLSLSLGFASKPNTNGAD